MHRLGTASLGSMIRGVRSGHMAGKSMAGSLNLAALGSPTSGSTMGSTWTGTTWTGTHAAVARSLTTRASTLESYSKGTHNPGSLTGSLTTSVSIGPRTSPKNPYISSPRALRTFSSTSTLSHNHIHKPKDGEELHVTFISKDGSQQTFEVAEGDNILDIAQSYNLDMEGACGGSCACSTCHVIVDPEFYDEIPEPDDDENDMLDLAFGLTETSRLGCQIKMSKALDGIRIALPAMTRNLQSRDFN